MLGQISGVDNIILLKNVFSIRQYPLGLVLRSIRLMIVSDKCFERNTGVTVVHVIMLHRLYQAGERKKKRSSKYTKVKQLKQEV